MKPIQILLLAFVLFSLVRVIHRYRRQGMRPLDMLFWMLAWVGAAFIINFPGSTSLLARFLGIGRGADLIMYCGLLTAFYLVFRIHVALDRVENEITEVVRSMALERLGEPRGPSPDEHP